MQHFVFKNPQKFHKHFIRAPSPQPQKQFPYQFQKQMVKGCNQLYGICQPEMLCRHLSFLSLVLKIRLLNTV